VASSTKYMIIEKLVNMYLDRDKKELLSIEEYNNGQETAYFHAVNKIELTGIQCPCGADELRYIRKYENELTVTTISYINVAPLPRLEEVNVFCKTCEGLFNIKKLIE